MRKIIERDCKELEKITSSSLAKVGLKRVSKAKAALLMRLVFSGVSRYFFLNPDTAINLGFLKFKKSPKKEEMFTVTINPSVPDGVVNADTMWRYYTGELAKKEELKEVLNKFVEELLSYSQMQEVQIAQLTSNLSVTEERKGEEHGV